MKYTTKVIHDNLSTTEVRLGLGVFAEHLNHEGIGLRVFNVTNSHVVYEPFIISWDAPISLKTVDGDVTTLRLIMHVHGLPSWEKESILNEAQVMFRTKNVFVVDKEHCAILGIQEVNFVPNIGEAYYKVMKHGTFMPHSYPVPKRWASRISKTIEDVTVDYVMSLGDSYSTREEVVSQSEEYDLTSRQLYEDIQTPNTCFITPKGHTECAFDLFDNEVGTLFSAVSLTGAEQEQVYEGIINYLKTSADDAFKRALHEWEANLRYGV